VGAWRVRSVCSRDSSGSVVPGMEGTEGTAGQLSHSLTQSLIKSTHIWSYLCILVPYQKNVIPSYSLCRNPQVYEHKY
jgi:hypothetical protein